MLGTVVRIILAIFLISFAVLQVYVIYEGLVNFEDSMLYGFLNGFFSEQFSMAITTFFYILAWPLLFSAAYQLIVNQPESWRAALGGGVFSLVSVFTTTLPHDLVITIIGIDVVLAIVSLSIPALIELAEKIKLRSSPRNPT